MNSIIVDSHNNWDSSWLPAESLIRWTSLSAGPDEPRVIVGALIADSE